MNLYAYAGNNPVAYADPFGLSPCKGFWGCTKALAKMEARGVMAGMDLTTTGPGPNDGGAGFFAGRLIAAMSGGGSTLGRGATAARAASSEATFFRGVSAAEAGDATVHGLRAGAAAAGNTGKYLTNSVEAAAQWGAQNGAGSQVLQITVPADATAAFTSLGRIDGIGQAWWAPIEALQGAKVEVVEQAVKEAIR